jgi:hypothetical protein
MKIRSIACAIILIGAVAGTSLAGVFIANPSFGYSRSRVNAKVGRTFTTWCDPVRDTFWYISWKVNAKKKCLYQNVENSVAWNPRAGNIGGRVNGIAKQVSGDQRLLNQAIFETDCRATTRATMRDMRILSVDVCEGGGDAVY